MIETERLLLREWRSGDARLMERLGMARRPDLDFEDPRYGAEINPTIVHLLEADQWKP